MLLHYGLIKNRISFYSRGANFHVACCLFKACRRFSVSLALNQIQLKSTLASDITELLRPVHFVLHKSRRCCKFASVGVLTRATLIIHNM